jgi:DNA-binding MarR family transcriptional regulator
MSASLDAETRADDSHVAELRLWLRMLTCTTLIEGEIRRRLREAFDVTLPRFDLMAQLHKAPGGLSLGELSRRMMVTAGNVTALVERLVADGQIERSPSAQDRRTVLVKLTPAGEAAFENMARAHGAWIAELFARLSPRDIEQLMDGLSRTKESVRAGIDAFAKAPAE